MTGSVTKGRTDGTWYLRVELPPAADGRRRRRRETFHGTKREADRRLRELVREAESGAVSLERLSIASIADRWLVAKEHNIAPRTLVRYRQIVKDFIVPQIGGVQADALRGAHIDEAVRAWRAQASVKDGRPLSPRSVRHAYDATRALCRWAVHKGLLATNPCDRADPPKWNRREMRTLDEAGLAKLLAAIAGTELEIPVIVLVGTGLRRGELFGLRWPDVDLDAARLSVRRSIQVVNGRCSEKAPKTAGSVRTVALTPFVVDALRRQKREQLQRRLAFGLGRDENAYVFDRADGSAWNPDLFGWRFADVIRRKNLTKVRLHDLRHSFATFSLAAGIDLKSISAALGHSAIAVTANTYAHVTESLQRENAARLEERIGGVFRAAAAGGSDGLRPTLGPRESAESKKARQIALPLVAPAGFEPALPP